ncbi:MAG: hypothetical protein HYR60_25050 [Acidobacteria bacterium]|nr:hypothetical protein [Acidobacteriota bacterium]
MAPRLLLLAATTGYSTRVFADQTRRLGYHLTLATDRCRVLDDPWGDHAFPVRFEQPEEAAVCLALGFELAQGFLYGKPATARVCNRLQK